MEVPVAEAVVPIETKLQVEEIVHPEVEVLEVKDLLGTVHPEVEILVAEIVLLEVLTEEVVHLEVEVPVEEIIHPEAEVLVAVIVPLVMEVLAEETILLEIMIRMVMVLGKERL